MFSERRSEAEDTEAVSSEGLGLQRPRLRRPQRNERCEMRRSAAGSNFFKVILNCLKTKQGNKLSKYAHHGQFLHIIEYIIAT